ncbi:serine hydrolase, partial [Steroidobacter sp.]|uniref:serine hydrolase n=1 Tax=Steroidobacter sp. TaxID=1978227 RepID=UPI001A630D4B
MPAFNVLRVVAATLLLPAVAWSANLPKDPLPPDFDRGVERMMQQWSIPGTAVAIVRAGRPDVVRSYGKRQWNRNEPVDGRTLFGIASVTKTFIAGAFGLLVQEGKVQWDDPIVKYLPEFRLADPWISTQVTIRDLLSHRSGFASYGDFLEEIPNLSERNATALLAHYPQAVPFRSRGDYNSLGFIVLSQVLEKVSGQPWEQFLHERLWQTLELRDTYARSDEFVPAANVLPTGDGWSEQPTGLDAVPASVNVAAPHVQWEAHFQGRFVYDAHELANRTVHFHRTAIDPSQSAFTSVTDLARWARVLMSPEDGSKSPLEARTVEAMRELNAIRRPGWPMNWSKVRNDVRNDLRTVGYGLGLEIYTYRGRTLVGHSGGELGYSTLMLVDPYAGFGVVVMANNATRTFGAMPSIMQTVLDWNYGERSIDWSAHYLERGAREHTENLAELAQLNAARPTNSPPTLSPTAMVGEYLNPKFGTVRVFQRDGRLIATTGPSYEIEFDHWAGDIYRGTVISPL